MHKFDISFRVIVGGSNKDEAFRTAWQEITKVFDDPELLLVEEVEDYEEAEEEDEKPTLRIIGTDSNAFALMGKAKEVMKQHGYDKADITKVLDECMAGDYNNLLSVLMQHFNVE